MYSRSSKLSLVFTCLFLSVAVWAQNFDTTKSKLPVATVAGQTIYEDELLASAQGQLQPLRAQEYEIKKKALDSLIEQKVVEAAAKKKGLTSDQLLVQEVDSKIADPSDAELEGFYFALRDKMKSPFAEVKSQLRSSVQQAKIQLARQDYIKSLKTDADVVVLLSVPRVEVGYDPARVRGNAKAPVMIVEFSDYQCPYCKQAETTIQAVLAKYGDKVSLAYHDYPLRSIHSQAEIAAEASRCALEQGKYWEYHDQLFTAAKLEKDELIGFARNLKLDEKQFDSCLASEKYKADIDKDLEEGRKAGVSGTPSFFINGISSSGAQSFTQIIDEELARKRAPRASVSIKAVPTK